MLYRYKEIFVKSPLGIMSIIRIYLQEFSDNNIQIAIWEAIINILKMGLEF